MGRRGLNPEKILLFKSYSEKEKKKIFQSPKSYFVGGGGWFCIL
jgi:hypothetical protein